MNWLYINELENKENEKKKIDRNSILTVYLAETDNIRVYIIMFTTGVMGSLKLCQSIPIFFCGVNNVYCNINSLSNAALSQQHGFITSTVHLACISNSEIVFSIALLQQKKIEEWLLPIGIKRANCHMSRFYLQLIVLNYESIFTLSLNQQKSRNKWSVNLLWLHRKCLGRLQKRCSVQWK